MSLTASVLHAQQAIQYGESATGTLAATAPVQVYNFSGEAGDFVTISVMSLTPGFQPVLSVLSVSGQPLPSEVLNLGNVTQYSLQLMGSGVHTIIVSGGSGDYALTLAGQPASATVDVSPESGGEAPLTAEQVFTIPSAESEKRLTVATNPPAAFTATLRGGDAGLFNVQASGGAATVTFALPASAAPYTLVVTSSGAENSVVSIALEDAAPQPTAPTLTPTVPAPAATVTVPASPTVAEPPAATPTLIEGEPCTVTSLTSSGVNVRSGPSTDYPVVASLPADTAAAVIGVNGAWYYIELADFTQGWVFSQVVRAEGACDALPTIAAPVEATPTPTPTSTTAAPAPNEATPTTAALVEATATFTPSYTPTTAALVEATATFTPSYTPTTPPAAQVAPEDARFNNPLVIPLDNTASVLDFVSYPGGDREDRVRWDITGMNSVTTMSGGRARLVISVSCFGEGTENVEFFTGGQTYACGETLVDREVTANSRTGSVVITAIGGDATYVQWVLTGTATRVN